MIIIEQFCFVKHFRTILLYYIDMSNFSERFKELKRESGLSNEKLGKLLGVSHMTICRWENGQTDIRSQDLIKVAQFFDVSILYLLGLED